MLRLWCAPDPLTPTLTLHPACCTPHEGLRIAERLKQGLMAIHYNVQGWRFFDSAATTSGLEMLHISQRAMNMTEDQKRTLCTEFGRTLAGSAQLLHQREALWRQALGVQIMGRDGRLTERMSAVRDECCPEATTATPAT